MKVTYQTCCGVDIHKSFLVAIIVKTTGGIEPSYQKKRFSTFNNSILEFKQWLLGNNCRDVWREYTRYRYKLVSCRSSEKNRYQNALTVCNVALDSVVSNIFEKSSTSIIGYLLEQPNTSINHKEIASKLLRNLKSKEDAVIESTEGYQMTDAQKYRIRLVRAHMDYITSSINDIDSMIEKMISSEPDYENAIQLLTTISGVKRDSAITIISNFWAILG